MNVKLTKTLIFNAGLVFEGNFFVNSYRFTAEMLTVSDNHREQNVAYERLKSWVSNVLENSILIDENDPDISSWAATGARLVILPDEPVDQILGILLYLKLNAIMENRLVVTNISIESSIGDNMRYSHFAGETLGDRLSRDGWWVDHRPIWGPIRHKDEGKVVSLDRQIEWSDYGLDWKQESQEEKNSVVFADFAKNENK